MKLIEDADAIIALSKIVERPDEKAVGALVIKMLHLALQLGKKADELVRLIGDTPYAKILSDEMQEVMDAH